MKTRPNATAIERWPPSSQVTCIERGGSSNCIVLEFSQPPAILLSPFDARPVPRTMTDSATCLTDPIVNDDPSRPLSACGPGGGTFQSSFRRTSCEKNAAQRRLPPRHGSPCLKAIERQSLPQSIDRRFRKTTGKSHSTRQTSRPRPACGPACR